MNEYICIYDEDEMGYIQNPYEERTWLVRCKICEHRFDGEHVPNCCAKLMEKCGWVTEISVDDNWFCADGERKEE